MVMVTLTGEGATGRPPTVHEVRERYGLAEDDIDESFGVVEVDPVAHVYTVLVKVEAAARLVPDAGWHTEGPYSNPPIEPFGPPEA